MVFGQKSTIEAGDERSLKMAIFTGSIRPIELWCYDLLNLAAAAVNPHGNILDSTLLDEHLSLPDFK